VATKIKLNRIASPKGSIFEDRGNNVKWPTLRKGYLVPEAIERIKARAQGPGKSIVFLVGEYKTNFNKFVNLPPEEPAVFFEWLIRSPKNIGGIYLLCWVGQFHNGSIFHCSYQYPQVLNWTEENGVDYSVNYLEYCASKVYLTVADAIYNTGEMDSEVQAFKDEFLKRRMTDRDTFNTFRLLGK